MDTAYQQIQAALQQQGPFLIVSHVNPDGDTIGSALAMAYIVQHFGGTFELVNEGVIPSKYHFLPMADQIKRPADITSKYDKVIAVDCADKKRMGSQVLACVEAEPIILINIDHHPTNDLFGTINLIEPKAASTTLVIYHLIKYLGIDLDQNLALNLYTGLMTDTGSFKYSNTTEEVHLVTAELIRYGIDVYDVVDRIYETMSFAKLTLIKDALSTLQVDQTGKIAWITVKVDRVDHSALADDLDGLVNYPRSIEGVEVAISFKVIDEHKTKVSFRSKKYVDVSKIAAGFGGGGHERAAGCTIDGALDVIMETIISEITNFI